MFIREMTAKFPTFYDIVSRDTIRKIQKLCFRWEYLSFSLASFMTLDQFDYFKQSYPMLHEAVYDFVLAADRIRTGGLLVYEKAHLYYDFLFCLLSDKAIQALERKVHVFIDFSGGEDYNQFLTMNIQSFDYLDIVVDKKVTASTDIYVSDFFNSKVRCEQIIWKNPPLAHDWKEFADKVIRVRGNRAD
ncbi:hypothetical protein A5875_004424 [Enterococcus sp. 3H8_DIV0648]|nr:hypothetical protein A5875_004424 [Enterococcus sp. 3H8_DIV0648]